MKTFKEYVSCIDEAAKLKVMTDKQVENKKKKFFKQYPHVPKNEYENILDIAADNVIDEWDALMKKGHDPDDVAMSVTIWDAIFNSADAYIGDNYSS